MVRDPFAQEKAAVQFVAGLRKRNLQPIDLDALIKRIGEDTRVDFSGPATDEKIRIFIAELPKHVDAVLLGHVSAWGLFSRESTQLIRVPVYGYVSGYGGSASWQSSQWIPVPRTRDVSIVGLSLAIVRVTPDTSPALAWQYSHVHTDRGGNLVWQRPRTPDQLAADFLNDIVNALPLKP